MNRQKFGREDDISWVRFAAVAHRSRNGVAGKPCIIRGESLAPSVGRELLNDGGVSVKLSARQFLRKCRVLNE